MEYWALVWDLVKLHTQVGWEIFKLTWFIPAWFIALYFVVLAIDKYTRKKKWREWLSKHGIRG